VSDGGPEPGAERSAAPGSSRTALVIGATGLIGGECVDLLLADPTYAAVKVVGRRPVDRRHPKLVQYQTDLGRLRELAEIFPVDAVFCCLGTTIRKAGSREAFRRVDVEYPVLAGRLAAETGAGHFLVVSALGADARSRVPYNRAKGDMENALRALALPALWIFRPSVLLGSRREFRPAEWAAQLALRPLMPLMRGPLGRYRPVRARDVAAAMVRAAARPGPGQIVESEEI
jgi:uncharacterized protein YbjT (DUF2867 family)